MGGSLCLFHTSGLSPAYSHIDHTSSEVFSSNPISERSCSHLCLLTLPGFTVFSPMQDQTDSSELYRGIHTHSWNHCKSGKTHQQLYRIKPILEEIVHTHVTRLNLCPWLLVTASDILIFFYQTLYFSPISPNVVIIKQPLMSISCAIREEIKHF